MPVSAHGTPKSPRSKSPIACGSALVPSVPRHCWSMPSTTRFVLVPMSVHVPPRMLAKESGIITCSFGMWMFSAQRWTMGIITATTGVLFKKPDTNAMGTIRRTCAPAIVRGLPSSLDMYQSKPPVALIPAATTNNVATVNSPSLLNPARPSSTETTPAAMRIVSAPTITWSGWTTSHSKHTNAPTTTTTVNHPSHTAPMALDAIGACRGGRDRRALRAVDRERRSTLATRRWRARRTTERSFREARRAVSRLPEPDHARRHPRDVSRYARGRGASGSAPGGAETRHFVGGRIRSRGHLDARKTRNTAHP